MSDLQNNNKNDNREVWEKMEEINAFLFVFVIVLCLYGERCMFVLF